MSIVNSATGTSVGKRCHHPPNALYTRPAHVVLRCLCKSPPTGGDWSPGRTISRRRWLADRFSVGLRRATCGGRSRALRDLGAPAFDWWTKRGWGYCAIDILPAG